MRPHFASRLTLMVLAVLVTVLWFFCDAYENAQRQTGTNTHGVETR